jgi:CDP-4-dehydro-6-deoxyglucose reductase/ferredoxin-NAD(P)+ reductase (naphthalene dioxygenase ferredoxin-specific)
MSFTVTVRQFSDPLAVEIGQTILEAALARDLPYPHGCRSGNCGACKSELIGGEVEMSPYSEFALTAGEKSGGLILACRAVPWSDCEVRFLEQEETVVHPLRHMTCRVRELFAATHDIRVLRLEILSGGPFTFSAGQYASLEFAGLPPRDYSMANRPDEPILEFHLRLLPGGAVTPFVASRLKVGDTLKVAAPHGTAHLRETHAGPVIALAGGTGLAPIKSIIETALAGGMRQPIALYLGVRDEPDIYLEDHFRRLCATHPNLAFTPVLSEPTRPTARRTGFLAAVVRQDLHDCDGWKAYLAGPPIMVETAMKALVTQGLRPRDCHADAFYTEADKAALAASGAA